MVGKKRNRDSPKKVEEPKVKRRRPTDENGENVENIERYIGILDPRTPHPRDLDQPSDHNFDMKDLGEQKEGEIFDNFEIEETANRTRGGATCNSVLVMKHNKPLPMWFDDYLCPRVMPGKWCGYVGYAFRRRIRIGSWPRWKDVPDHVKDDAWDDILASWDFRTALSKEEHAKLRKQWTTYASNKMRNWRTSVWNRYVKKKRPEKDLGHPCLKYKWLDPKEWDLFVKFRSTPSFTELSNKNRERALEKKYRHRTGSGGYRKIYIRKAKELREKEIERRMEADGITREEAEEAVRDMVFTVDRSIVFLEANIDAKTKTYSDEFVRDLAAKILEMNKDKEEGRLIIEGRRDILAIVTDEDDHPGRWRGCPGTAKIDFALPDFVRLRSRNKKKSRKRSKDCDSSDDEEKVIEATLEDFTCWIAGRLGVELTEDISPQKFLEEQRLHSSTTAPENNTLPTKTRAPDGEPGDDQGLKSCYLGVFGSSGSIVTAAAGMEYPTAPPEPGLKFVQIRPPLFIPAAELPFPNGNHCNIAVAVGENLLWPADLIHYTIQEPQQESPERTASDSSLDTKPNCSPQTDDGDDSDLDGKALNATTPVPPETVVTNFKINWEFAHHTREPKIRVEVAKWLTEMQHHPNTRAHYSIPLKEQLFGPRVKNLTLMLDDALAWMKTIDRRRKEWIHGWQMDMWGSLIYFKLQPEERARVQLISAFTSYSGQATEANAMKTVPANVIELMEQKPATLYVMPLCRVNHWVMIIIHPERSVFYCLDPDGKGITQQKNPFLHKLLMRCAEKYDADIRPKLASQSTPKKWSITNIIHKKQPGSWECGYYCMLYLEKIVLLYKGLDIHEVFPEDLSTYSNPVIEGMIDTFCFYLMDSIAPTCRARLLMRRTRNN